MLLSSISHRARPVVFLGALALTVISCSNPEPVIEPPTSSTVAVEDSPNTTESSLSAEASSDDAAEQTASEFLEVFLTPTDSYDQWWAEISPYLSADAHRTYEYVDPRQVPDAEVGGDTEILRSADLETVVAVETNIGTFTVQLTRANTQDEWQAEYVTPPETETGEGEGN